MTPASSLSSPSISNTTPLVDLDLLAIEQHLKRMTNRLRNRYAHRPEFEAASEHLARFILNGGKRVRPRLCTATYRILAELAPDATVPRPLLWVASSLELFHAFMLVHDDLIDRSPIRRNRLSLHESIRRHSADFLSQPMPEHKANSIALVIGDTMFTVGMSMVAQANLKGRSGKVVQKIISDMLVETGLGQILDILFEDRPLHDFSQADADIVDAYLYKTARYTITGPMLIGAAMAGSSPELLASLGRLGDQLGLAYQIRNDLEDIDKAAAGLESSDIDTGKRTTLLLHTYRNLSPLGKRTLTGLLDQPVSDERRRQILSLMETTGSIEHAQQWAERLLVDALATAHELPLPIEKRQAIARLVSLRTH